MTARPTPSPARTSLQADECAVDRSRSVPERRPRLFEAFASPGAVVGDIARDRGGDRLHAPPDLLAEAARQPRDVAVELAVTQRTSASSAALGRGCRCASSASSSVTRAAAVACSISPAKLSASRRPPRPARSVPSAGRAPRAPAPAPAGRGGDELLMDPVRVRGALLQRRFSSRSRSRSSRSYVAAISASSSGSRSRSAARRSATSLACRSSSSGVSSTGGSAFARPSISGPRDGRRSRRGTARPPARSPEASAGRR